MSIVLPPAPLLVRDRLIGGVVGALVGDALGVPVEFCERAERDRDPVRGMRGWGTHAQPRGTWSDDGALTMAHIAAFLEHGWDPDRHLRAFADWYERAEFSARGRVFDIGRTTRAAIKRYLAGVPAARCGRASERDNGNGSLMRHLPVACWWAADGSDALIEGALAASALTHAHPRACWSCAIHALVVAGMLERRPLHEALARSAETVWARLPPEERPHFAPLLDLSCLRWPRERVPSDGYVLSSLMAACWCVHRHDGYAAAVLEAVNLGGDADTIACIAGGLAGLRCGLTGIPRAWVSCLARSRWVLAQAERFADACLARAARRVMRADTAAAHPSPA